MEMKGEQLVPASQIQVWDALNDPAILKECVPGCDSIDKLADNEYQVLMVARVGPVSAKFKGKLTISDQKPPDSYSIAFDGQGGVAGFGKGSANVSLAPEGDATRLSYAVKATVGGKLAQIGSRLVDAAARKIADSFFKAFNEKVGALAAHEQETKAEHAEHGGSGDHLPEPVPRDPDLPDVAFGSLAFFAAGSLVVFLIALITLF